MVASQSLGIIKYSDVGYHYKYVGNLSKLDMLFSKCVIWALVNVAVAKDHFRSKLLDKYKYQELSTTIVKSASDDREYLGLVLLNGMKVLLVSDPKTGSAAASMDVAVGYMADPESMPGLAHFCEHMLFMGNKKYPDPSSYFEHLKSNGGGSDAYTIYDRTNYFFSVNYDSLESTLDRFSQFFISPLFSAEAVEKEVNAVNSEYQKNSQSDMFRIDQVHKHTLNQSHPYSHFCTGNYDTLFKIPKENRIDPRQEIINFYNKYYSANQMRLVVLGRESLDQLKNMAIHMFSNVHNSKIPRPSIPPSPFSKDYLGVEIDINPVENSQTLLLQFPLPSQAKHYKEKPISVINQFLGQESRGSAMEHLRNVGWATTISCTLSEENLVFNILNILIELTPLGFENKDTVVQLILEYAKLIKEKDIEEYFKEMAKINEIKFRFQERTEASNYASSLASAMQNPNPLSKILSSQHLMSRFAPELIREMLSYISKENLRLSVVARFADAELKEPVYGTNYSTKKLPQLKPTGIKLQLPPPNTYIPDNFDLIDTNPQIQMLHNDSQGILWHAGNPTKAPKARLYILLKNTKFNRSPKMLAHTKLVINILKMQLKAFVSNAQMTDLSYDIVTTANGLKLEFSGYSQKIETFISDVLNRIKNIEISESSFKLCKDNTIQEIENSQYRPLLDLSVELRNASLLENTWSQEMLLLPLAHISQHQLSKFAEQLLGSAKLEILVVGNLDECSARRVMEASQNILDLKSPSSDLLRPTRPVVIPHGNHVTQRTLKNKEEETSAITFYLDMYSYNDTIARVSTELLGQMLAEPAFNQLRTKEQLGYIVDAKMQDMSSRGGLAIFIQSAKNPIFLESRIEEFLKSFHLMVEKMSEETFQKYKTAIKSSIQHKQRNLQETADFHWKTIDLGLYDFGRGNLITNYN
ncbi:metalloprotease [Entomophthora muscae]|uniref:Metalloprotease n=1 Tax=Entomophthora muscae TaxID=34485 RepID=A0ACC2UT38_9FUNG|nr:metalloprotease [Entomophthora muscae]